MNQGEDFKRKISGITTFKNNTPLIAIPIKQRKKIDVSRQKEQKKSLLQQQKIPAKIILQHQDQNVKNTKPINFRNLKDTIPKKQTTAHPKTQVKVPKNTQDYYQKVNKQYTQPDSHGIPINVNIQGVLPKQNENMDHYHIKNDRLLIGQQRRKTKKPMICQNKNIVQDLECTEQINFKWTPVQKKGKINVQKHQEKIPLIQKKILRTDHQRNKTTIVEQKQLLRKLELEADNINSAFQTEALFEMDQRQNSYLVPPHYIQKSQKNFNWMMRVILVEWMMHVSYEFSMKRQTFHIAVNLIDLYMSKQHHLPKSSFQLVGAASMFIASKLEEFEPKCSQDFAQSTKGRYTADQIKSMQLKICKKLNFKINPPTIYMWANRFMLQWDIYLQQNPYAKNHHLFTNKTPSYFKKCDKDCLRLFRQFVQYIDYALLHIHTAQYKPKLLACAFLYLVLGADMDIFSRSQIVTQFPDKSQYLLDQQNPFNNIFMVFLEQSLGIILIDLLPTIQYAASFFNLSLCFQDPLIPDKIQRQEVSKGDLNFEEYCSFQTHNPNMTVAIKHRNKNLR